MNIFSLTEVMILKCRQEEMTVASYDKNGLQIKLKLNIF